MSAVKILAVDDNTADINLLRVALDYDLAGLFRALRQTLAGGR